MGVIKFKGYRLDEVRRILNSTKVKPIDIMFTGVTGAGKSTTLNMFFDKTVAKVGTGVDPETMYVDSYLLSNYCRIWDTPGLGDGVDIDEQHKAKMINLLNRTYQKFDKNLNKYVRYGSIDICVVVVDGSNRDMGTTYKLLDEVIIPNIEHKRILVALNQADMAMKGRHFDLVKNCPDDVLLSFLEEKVLSIKKRIKDSNNIEIIKPVYYSAEKGYNATALYDMILDNVPHTKRKMR